MFERYRRSADQESDARLVRALHLGDAEAMAELYRRHGSLIYRFVLRMSRDVSIAEEITQEVFLAILRQPANFDPQRAALSTWLCGIARRQLWKHLEQTGRYVALEPGDDVSDYESKDDPGEWLSRKEAITAVRVGIDQLPLLLREVVSLCELEGMTYEQASFILAVPIGTVRSRLHRAKVKLATLLRDVPACAGKEKQR